MGRQMWPCVKSPLPTVLEQRFLRTPMISPFFCTAVKKAVERYEEVAGTKINFDNSKGLRLNAWRAGVSLPVPFRWSDGPVRILGVCSGPASN